MTQAPRAFASATASLACWRSLQGTALRRLHEFAFVQLHVRAADHQLLYKESVAKPEDGADIVALSYAVEHDRYRPPWPGKKLVSGELGAAQLRRCQRPAHCAPVSR